MAKLAMVPELQAVRGLVFKAFIDPRCFECSFYNACSKSLRPGWSYKILSVRRVSHVCPVINEKMYVVEVEEVPLRAVIESKLAVAGLKLRYKRVVCDEKECGFRSCCRQAPLHDGEVVMVVRARGRIACPRELHLTLVELLPVE